MTLCKCIVGGEYFIQGECDIELQQGWSLPYAQYLELRLESQCGHRVTCFFFFLVTGSQRIFHSGHRVKKVFPNSHRQNSM